MRISHLAFLFSLAAAMTVQAQSPVASGSAAARAPRPVGHPVQPEDDRQALAAFLARVGMADSPSLAALQDCAGQSYVATSDARYASCTAGLGQIDTYFQRNPASIIQQSSKQDFEIAKLNLAGLRAWEEEIYYYTSDVAKSQDARDQAMAYAFGVLRGQRFPKARTVIWAHNFHLAKGPLYGQHPMGSYLVQSLGKSYVDFALVAHEMDIDWLGVGCGPRDLPFADSVENRLHELGPPTLLVDLAFPGTTDPYLPPGEYGLGYYRMDPRQLYNGIFYLDISPKMTPLAWPSCQ